MEELSQTDLVYSPRSSLQLWNVFVNWLDFFYQFFLKILRPFSHHPLPDGFKPLPVIELSDMAAESPVTTIEISSGRTSTEGEVSNIHRLTVVLDLDETLVSAYETSSLPDNLRTQAIEAGLKWFELECISSTKECNGVPKINYVTVFERPGLHEFLEKLSQFAHLVIFTAGLEDYARPLVDKIDTKNVLNDRLYRSCTVSTQYRDHVKDLLCTSKNMCRTVIVDNNPYSFLLQPLNGIPCVPFSADQPHDTQVFFKSNPNNFEYILSSHFLMRTHYMLKLLDIILPLLKQLSEEEDVRGALYDRFHMPEWFEKQGIPRSCWTSSQVPESR
ncbi:unnamed protein product [Eruca vesicaria subsp. sativa]|uniref:FCP1 homology domain-containing protein n=1 Tax=Eruca vesicaria subsp. sativa TaxID=29727 RepID=A0ABC8L8G4_ERUVS|nr:unnamed protein product [Eruca vesicaria subsp. sativa]